MIPRQTLLNWCNETLQPQLFKDGAPNGLQVEGNDQIRYIITAVTASQAAINHAVEQGADTLLVHHGLFWRSEPTAIIGWKKQRIAALLAHNINLIGYHLPLDAHPTLGNNAQLAAKLNWQPENTFGEQNLLNIGTLPENQRTLAQLAQAIEQTLGRTPTIIGNPKQPLTRIAWCTGGAQWYFQAAIDADADVYLTGEISEAQYHLANETDTAFIAAGHHATERYGIPALAQAAARRFGIETCFFDEDNPA